MRQVVRDNWIEMNTPLEGCLDYMYADVLNLITTGMGNLIDPVSAALGLPWVYPDGRMARGDEISAAWNRVKGDPYSRVKGHLYAKELTDLRLRPDGVETVIFRRLDSNEAILSKRLVRWNDYGACVQMAVHSLAWACGPNCHFPRLFSALDVLDFDAASTEIMMNEWSKGPNGESVHNAGLVPRNVANKILMRNASRVEAYGLDPDLLDWTHLLGVSEAETQPNLYSASRPTVCPLPREEPDDET